MVSLEMLESSTSGFGVVRRSASGHNYGGVFRVERLIGALRVLDFRRYVFL